MQLLGVRVEEDVKRRHQMRMHGKLSQKDNFAELQAWLKAVKEFLHRLDCDLEVKGQKLGPKIFNKRLELTTLPFRPTLLPFPRTFAKATLPKLPSPTSLIISNRSVRATFDDDWNPIVPFAILLVYG
jgi:hypothetical protein